MRRASRKQSERQVQRRGTREAKGTETSQPLTTSTGIKTLEHVQLAQIATATDSVTSTPARAKLPTLILKEVARKVGLDGTELRTNELHFEGMDVSEGRKVLSASLGIDEESLYSVLSELAGVTQSRSEGINCTNLNYAVSMMHGLEPKDQAERMLAAQMAVTHMAVMSEASLLRVASGHKSRDLHERTFNKLARTFTAQMAALKNHRSPHGQQKMIVEHVNVHEGGQAIVGQVERTGGQQ